MVRQLKNKAALNRKLLLFAIRSIGCRRWHVKNEVGRNEKKTSGGVGITLKKIRDKRGGFSLMLSRRENKKLWSI